MRVDLRLYRSQATAPQAKHTTAAKALRSASKKGTNWRGMFRRKKSPC